MSDLEDFIQKILEVQGPSSGAPSTAAELRSTAFHLGVSAEEWAEVEAAAQKRLTTGLGFLRYENWDDAVRELEQALVIYPDGLEILSGLSLACSKVWRRDGREEDREKAEKYAQQCLAQDPAHEEALRLISEIRKKPAPRRRGRMLIVLALCGWLAAGGLALYLYLGTESEPRPTPTSAGPESSPRPEAGPALEGKLFTAGLGLPVRVIENEKSQGLNFLIERSVFDRYEEAYAYKMAADILVEDRLVEELVLKLELVDQDGKVVFSELKKALETYNPSARPGDLAPVDFLKFVRTDRFPKPSEMRVSVHSVQSLPVGGEFEPSRPVDLIWDKKPSGYDLEVRERFSSFAQGYLLDQNDARHELALEIENTGRTPIKKLELALVYLNNEGLELQRKKAIVNLDSRPRIKVGRTRVFGTITGLKNIKVEDVAGYEIRVVEIK